MGRVFEANCTTCQNIFRAHDGGGFSFTTLRCDVCGNEKGVNYEDIWETYLAFLKGGKSIFSEANGADGRKYAGEPITQEEYRRRVEDFAGKCQCGGRFTFDAPIRCPKCRSDSVTEDGNKTIMFYD